jgi:hypothetical protein
LDGGASRVEASVLAFTTQLKKGDPRSACAAPARRWEVFFLVPRR